MKLFKDLKQVIFKVLIITVVGLLIFSQIQCKDIETPKNFLLEINELGEAPLTPSELIKLRFFYTDKEVEIHQYRINTVWITKFDRVKFENSISLDIEEFGDTYFVNTYYVEAGVVFKKGAIDIVQVQKSIDSLIDNSSYEARNYNRIYPKKYNYYQSIYLEFFANSFKYGNKNKSHSYQTVDSIEYCFFKDLTICDTMKLVSTSKNEYFIATSKNRSRNFNLIIDEKLP